MTPDALTFMDGLRPIEFTDTLSYLQGMIDHEVKVVINHYGCFFGCGMEGRLECVQTLPPDDQAVRVVLDGGNGLFLDPGDVETFVGGSYAHDGYWLEFRFPRDIVLTVEFASQK